jgi:hypothetical protein
MKYIYLCSIIITLLSSCTKDTDMFTPASPGNSTIAVANEIWDLTIVVSYDSGESDSIVAQSIGIQRRVHDDRLIGKTILFPDSMFVTFCFSEYESYGENSINGHFLSGNYSGKDFQVRKLSVNEENTTIVTTEGSEVAICGGPTSKQVSLVCEKQ